MLICHCRAQSDRDIRRATLEGARCPSDVARQCNGAGMACGGCSTSIESLLSANQRQENSPGQSRVQEPRRA